MTQHDDAAYLTHMLETARGAAAAVEGISFRTYLNDENLKIAVAHRIQVIGEATRRVSPETQSKVDVPWTEIIGMRHKIVPDYMGVDFDLIWATATQDLPV